MIRCLHILKAYSFKLWRRQQTCLLITIFIGTLVTIFHIYAYQHLDINAKYRSGNFHYQPGLFLKEKQPDENKTYCQFNYGLPETIDWKAIEINYPPELGLKSNYRVIYDVVTATEYANTSKYNAVTYVTQSTPEFLYHIVEIARFWDGPISLSLFTPNYDLDISIQILRQLCSCYENMTKISIHLFFPKNRPPRIYNQTFERSIVKQNISLETLLKDKLEKFRSLSNKTRNEYVRLVRENKAKRILTAMNRRLQSPIIKFENCGDSDFDFITYRRDKSIMYPINIGRNVARNATKTNYFLVSDIEMVPSDGLALKFLAMLRKLMGEQKRDEGCIFSNTVFVVPVFEVEKGERIPRTKTELMHMVDEDRAYYFHKKFCSHCQRFPGLMSWMKRPSPEGVEPMLIGRREFPYHRWEPLYFGTHKDPWYNEKLTWEGRQDKMTQMLEICLREYRLVILDGGFLCHAASNKSATRNIKAAYRNTMIYRRISMALQKKYSIKHACRPNFNN